MPEFKKTTYLKIVCSYGLQKEETHRVRFTVGGNHIEYDGDVFTTTTELTIIKIQLNSVVSNPGAKAMTADLEDFYLGTPIPTFEYTWFTVKYIPNKIMQEYHLKSLIHNGTV